MGADWLEHEVSHCPPRNADIKNGWKYICAPPLCLCGVDRDNFALVRQLLDNETIEIHKLAITSTLSLH